MGMRDELQAELAEAFNDPEGLADAVQSLTGTRTVDGEYDPEIGGSSSTTLTYAGRGVFGDYSTQEIDGSAILTSDTKLLALQNELLLLQDGVATATREAPVVGDVINGLRVINVSEDAAKATWSIQLRK